MTDQGKQQEEFSINGNELVERVKELIRQGNIRRISIKNEKGESVLEIPVTVGVVGAILVPTLAAVGAVAALLTKCTILVEKRQE